MRFLLIALALMAGAISPAISVSSAAADSTATPPVTGIGIRLVDVPTATADDPRARSYIIDHLKPGKTIERRIEVTNGTRARARVAVYSAAASVDQGGFVGAADHTGNELSGWTSVTPESLELPSRGRAFVKVTIRVPALAVRGENYGVVWAQITTKPKSGGVTQVSRVGIRLYLSVGPGGAPPSDFDIVSLAGVRDEKNVPMVQASVRNTGERALDLSGTLTLVNGPAGLSAGPFPVQAGTSLGIGDTQPVLVTLDPKLPDGPWLVKINVRSGVTERRAQATLTFPSAPGIGPVVEADSSLRSWGWQTAGVGIALLLLIALLAALLRRRKGEGPPPSARRAAGAKIG